MRDEVNILEGSTFVTSDDHGDIAGSPVAPHGLFAFDTRFLSRWKLTVDGQTPELLSTDDIQYYGAQFFMAPSTGSIYSNSSMSVIRRRSVGESMHEEISVINHSNEPRSVHVSIEMDADFADLFEVKDQLEKKGELYRRVDDGRMVFGYKRDDYVRETWVIPSDAQAQMSEKELAYDVALKAKEQWQVAIDVVPVVEAMGAERARQPSFKDDSMREGLRVWTAAAPEVESDWRHIERAYAASIRDLAALRFQLPIDEGTDRAIPAAGLPWFMSLFGRDSLITSYQALPYTSGFAGSTLETLANLQGTRSDDFRDEEPGKMPHELRFGELTAFEERPQSPYYGSADGTALWLVLLDEYMRWTGRAEVIRNLEPKARAAIDWIDKYGDRDGDGYIEYERRQDSGLDNQCWKDSWDSIAFSDGTIAPTPRATCELQGYAYDAKMRTARLARELWGDPAFAEKLEREAAELKQRFNRDFWLEDKKHFALALDGQKRKVDSLTSNVGHLLWSGIVDDDKVQPTVDALMSDRMFSGWGVRTMAVGEGSYNPIGYHVGTVWPHDNSIVVMGLTRYGYRAEAARIAQAMIEASSFFNYRLPEAFAGYPRSETHYPAEYPTACSPQAWATGTPLALISSVMGFHVEGQMFKFDPVLPQAISRLQVRGIKGRWGSADASANATDLMMRNLAESLRDAPEVVRGVFEEITTQLAPSATRSPNASLRFDLVDGKKWRIAIESGRIVSGESDAEAGCVLELREETLRGILDGDQNARTAMLSGKVKVRGDRAIATRFMNFATSQGVSS